MLSSNLYHDMLIAFCFLSYMLTNMVIRGR